MNFLSIPSAIFWEERITLTKFSIWLKIMFSMTLGKRPDFIQGVTNIALEKLTNVSQKFKAILGANSLYPDIWNHAKKMFWKWPMKAIISGILQLNIFLTFKLAWTKLISKLKFSTKILCPVPTSSTRFSVFPKTPMSTNHFLTLLHPRPILPTFQVNVE